jgi:hypothetical protein
VDENLDYHYFEPSSTSITIGADGLPVVSYYGRLDLHHPYFGLKVLHCSNATCVPYWRRR